MVAAALLEYGQGELIVINCADVFDHCACLLSLNGSACLEAWWSSARFCGTICPCCSPLRIGSDGRCVVLNTPHSLLEIAKMKAMQTKLDLGTSTL